MMGSGWSKFASRARRGRGVRARVRQWAALALACAGAAGPAGAADVTSTWRSGVANGFLWSHVNAWEHSPAAGLIVPNNGNGGYTFAVDLTSGYNKPALDMDVTVDTLVGELKSHTSQHHTFTATVGTVLSLNYANVTLNAGPNTTFGTSQSFGLSGATINLSADLAATGTVMLSASTPSWGQAVSRLSVPAGTTFTPGTTSFTTSGPGELYVGGTVDAPPMPSPSSWRVTTTGTGTWKSAGGTIVGLNSGGALEVKATKQLMLSGDANITGPVLLNTSSQLISNGATRIGTGASFAGPGKFVVTGGVTTFDAPLTVGVPVEFRANNNQVTFNQPVSFTNNVRVEHMTFAGPATPTFADLQVVGMTLASRLAIPVGGRMQIGGLTLKGGSLDVGGTLETNPAASRYVATTGGGARVGQHPLDRHVRAG
ncbi:MAG: hypothetical protein ACAI43_01370, partial [Phycisphaerae bacterium]